MRIARYSNLSLQHTTNVARIYRGQAPDNGPGVIVKIAYLDPVLDVAPQLRHDYLLSSEHPAPWRLAPIEWLAENDYVISVFRDPDGAPLEQRSVSADLDEKLTAALDLVDTLEAIHAEGFVHKDFAPPNLLLDSPGAPVTVVDFSLATRLSHEDAEPANFGMVEGNPAFCAPEQTGRMNRNVGRHSDYYTLGATLYQWFTGSPPFTMTSPIELVHAQIAMTPEPPTARNPKLPRALDAVILKLLSKAPEDRYQSLAGLRHDLVRIRDEWKASGQVTDFEPGASDQQRQFRLSTRLYGREQAESQLMAGFEDASRGEGAITMVTGPSGIGKTALIRQLYTPLTHRRAYFIRGKFDLLHRDKPYTAIMEALQQLLRDMLTESEEHLSQWRPALQEAMGSNGGLLTPLIPELALIIGPQGVVDNLEADESSRVFARIMLRLIRLFCTPERPLVLYLDDLQWADRASLELIDQLHRELSQDHFYFIGAYRDNEISSGHFLATLLDDMAACSRHFRSIHLSPMDQEAISHLLEDSLGQGAEQLPELSRELLNKTGGIPFFVHQFLESLYRLGHITLNEDGKRWRLSPESLGILPATDSQVAWMTDQLRGFLPRTQNLMQSAACLGSRFNLATLARFESVTIQELMEHLQPALEAGMVSITRDSLAPSGQDLTGNFAHDRIQQAAYQLMTEPEQQKRHRRLGQMLLRESRRDDHQQHLFEVVQHLNLGGKQGYDEQQCLDIAHLNGRAGTRAHNSAAYNAAYHFYSEGIAFLPRNCWERHYDLTLSLYDGAQEAAFLSQRFDTMEALGDRILDQARNILDTWKTYSVRIQACNVQNELTRAIEVARTFLDQLGVRFPRKPRTPHIVASLMLTRYQLHGRSIDSIRNMPEMRDRRQLAIMETLHRVASSAYFSEPALHPLLVLKMVRIAARHGHAPAYTLPYAPYCIVLCGVLHQYERGFEFGKLSLEFAEHPAARPLKCRNQVLVYTFVWHWKRYAGESIEPLRQSYEEGLETGDHEYAAYAAVVAIVNSFFVGHGLDSIAAQIERYYPDILRLNAGTGFTFLKVQAQMVANLREPGEKPWLLSGRYIPDEAAMAEECGQDATGLSCLLTAQLVMRYRFGQLDEALDLLAQLDRRADAIRAMLLDSDHHFFGGLARIAGWRQNGGRALKPALYRRIRQHRQRLRDWAAASPINFRQKHELLEAEWNRVLGRRLKAMRYYEAAISDAEAHGFLQDQALAEELAGNFCREIGMHYAARSFHGTARAHYQQWGATVLADRITPDSPAGEARAGSMQHWSAPDMDLAAFKSSLLAISRSQVHSTMMEAVIRSAVTFAGAQSGHLLLARPDGDLYVEAQWEVNDEAPSIFQATPLEKAQGLCRAVIHFVAHTGEKLVLDDAQRPDTRLPQLHTDPDVTDRQVRSVLSVPLISGDEPPRVMGVLYLENNATSGAFTPQRLETLEIICLAAAGRLELSRRAVTDGLTHLYNHEYFRTILETEIQLTRRKSRSLALIMLDVDHFKEFNDNWGHQCGDAVLQGMATTLVETARSADIVARYGGEEFAIILPETNLQQARETAERLRKTVEATPFTHQGHELHVTISLGIGELNTDVPDGAELIARADSMLYGAKNQGRNQVAG